MKKITLTREYRHVTPTKTTIYPAGEHENVTNEIAEAAEKAGATEGPKHGGGAATTGAKGGPETAQG